METIHTEKKYYDNDYAPKYIADFTVGSGTTQANIFNPLCGCGC